MSLREKIEHLPQLPGVYLMKDAKARIIYVGKAKNLKNRVSQYFHHRDQGIKTRTLVAEIHDFDLMVTKSEVEALLLERTLIRHHQPHYNILLRDDKEYPFVRVQFKDPWPRIEKVRRRKDDGARYIGPFGNAGHLNAMLKTVFRVFPMIRCSPHEFKNAKRPCSYYHMKMCLAPCTQEINRTEYLAMLERALGLLEGRNKTVKTNLQERMLAAAAKEHFELAAQLRDQIKLLELISAKQTVIINTIDDGDAVGMFKEGEYITFNVTMIRHFAVIGHDNFTLPATIDNDADTLVSFLLQYYHNRMVPHHLLLPFKLDNAADLAVVFSQDRRDKIQVHSGGLSGESLQLIELAVENAKFFADQQHQLKLRKRAELEILKDLLKLSVLPRKIECIDISNLQGSAIVASNICFMDGKPAKELYRRYNINSVQDKNDDFQSVFEVVTRRLERGVRDDDLPDLLVIDGGKGQLNAAINAAASFPQLPLAIIALAKSRLEKIPINIDMPRERSYERIFLPDTEVPIPLEEGSPAYRLMTQIRNEAHRFAITFHRVKRQKIGHRSILDEIPGVGPVLKKRLFDEFHDIEGMKKASLERLLEVKGLNEKIAVALHAILKNNSSPKINGD